MSIYTERSRKIIICSGILFFMLMSDMVCAAPAGMDNVILISWDGISKDTLLDLLQAGYLPNLSTLVQKGSFINITITDHFPDTMAGHAQILTGYPPEQTNVFKSMRYGEIPHGLTLFERLEETLGTDSISTVIVASQERSLGTIKGLPFYHAGKIVDYYYDRNSDAGLVGSVATEAVYHFAPKGRFFIFVHFRDAADAGYAYGAESPEQKAAIRKIDNATGTILKAIQDQELDKKTAMYVTTDHGFNTGPKDHTGQISLWMIANEPGYNPTGDQKDIAPTVLKRFGVQYENISPKYPGKALM